MNESTEEETNVLAQYFDFHPLSIEDATLVQQRPKFKQYDGYQFLVFHARFKNARIRRNRYIHRRRLYCYFP